MTKKAIFALLSCLWVSCSSGQSSTSSQSERPRDSETPTLSAKGFEVDSAYSYIQQQVAFGPRTPGSDRHKACGDWLVQQFKAWGYNTTEELFPGKDYYGKALQGRNIVVHLYPEIKQRILLMAHWDTRVVADEESNAKLRKEPIDGADDGASGVGVLLELARQFRLNPPKVGIDIVLFDLEDGGQSGDNDSWCLGSQYWAKHATFGSTPKPQEGILLDMVGAKDARFHWEMYSKAYARPLMMKLWDTAKQLGHIAYFPHSDGGAMVDDHVPVIEHLEIPCVDIINFSNDKGRTGFGEHWHTHQDNISIIDKATLRAVGETVSTYIYSL